MWPDSGNVGYEIVKHQSSRRIFIKLPLELYHKICEECKAYLNAPWPAGGMSSTLRRIGRLSGWEHINLIGDHTWQASGKAKEGQLQAATSFAAPNE
jgi:hypothetical protein